MEAAGIYMDTDFLPDRPFADYGDLFRWPFVTHKVRDIRGTSGFPKDSNMSGCTLHFLG